MESCFFMLGLWKMANEMECKKKVLKVMDFYEEALKRGVRKTGKEKIPRL